jgi:hypothetical protein
MAELAWVLRDDDKTNNPTEEGLYAVMVEGDSEQIEGHTIYAFDAYQTFAQFKLDQDDGGSFHGEHDEEDFTIYAYYGPIVIPEFTDPRG